MDLAKRAVLLMMVIMVGLHGLSMAAVYHVGDSFGWTILGVGYDYQNWAATKKFYAGDTLVFVYSNQFHNVIQVNLKEFKSCNPDSPIARYGKGNDSISLESSGEYYFLCGFPGHCQDGMKLHITVNSEDSTASPPKAAPIAPRAISVAPPLYTSKLNCLAMAVAILFTLLV
ncbi:hypothetical protein PTKIN_Ptkin18bG0037300 [Pterospermum kingtungense]